MSGTIARLGIDWGTHSSKWVSGDHTAFKILRSEVCLDEDADQIFMSNQPPPSGSIFSGSIKGKLLKNPEAAFWLGPQKRIKLSLGELVSFSLWSLVGEAYDDFLKRNGNSQPDGVEIRFSLPNWVDIAEGAIARACYEQAARVACHLFAQDPGAWSSSPRPTRPNWGSKVKGALEVLDLSDDSPIDAEPDGFSRMIAEPISVAASVTFRFVAESSAAGLTGLRYGSADDGRLRKILVVDVGAGSTDIGYVLRTKPRAETGAAESICQLSPANTCQEAGESLSRRIVGVYRARGQTITFNEAELRKTSGNEIDWIGAPSIKEWFARICEHVQDYVRSLPDKLLLPEKPGLRVLVTGGSGLVSGLEQAITAAVAAGLRERAVPASVVNETQAMSLALNGAGAADANRLAVALGAANEDLPRLKYFPKLDSRAIPHHGPGSWT